MLANSQAVTSGATKPAAVVRMRESSSWTRARPRLRRAMGRRRTRSEARQGAAGGRIYPRNHEKVVIARLRQSRPGKRLQRVNLLFFITSRSL